jgi:hypothetical protein
MYVCTTSRHGRGRGRPHLHISYVCICIVCMYTYQQNMITHTPIYCMYVCIYIGSFNMTKCTYIRLVMHTCIRVLSVCMYVIICMYECHGMYVCMPIYVCVCIYIYMSLVPLFVVNWPVCAYVCMCVWVYVCSVSTCMKPHTHIAIHTCRHAGILYTSFSAISVSFFTRCR